MRAMVHDAAMVLDEPLGGEEGSITRIDLIAEDRAAPETVFGQGEITNARLKAAFRRLHPSHRVVLARQSGLDIDLDELTEDIHPQTVKRARQRLRAIMDSDMEGITDALDDEGEPGSLGPTLAREKREYDPFASPMLDVRDGPWLTALMKRPPSTEFFRQANILIPEGSDRIYDGTKKLVTGSIKDRNLAARDQFFQMLGWADEAHPLHGTFQIILEKQTHLPSLEDFVFIQRAFALYGVKSETVLKSIPNAVVWHKDTVLPRLRALEKIGLNTAKTVHKYSNVLTVKEEKLHESVAVLLGYQVNAAKALELAPGLFNLAPIELGNRLANLEEKGFDAGKVVSRSSLILTRPIETVNGRIDELKELGLDAIKILSQDPSIVSYKWSTLRSKLDAFETLGLDWHRLIPKQPGLLHADIETISERLESLQRLARVLQWNGDVHELVLIRPAILQTAQSKLFLLAHMAADHLSEDAQNLSPNQVADAIKTPAESHLMAATRPTLRYTTGLALKYSREMKADARQLAVEKIFQDPHAVRHLGSGVVRAYNRHIGTKQ